MDALDEGIISELRRDARASNRAIARALGTSEAAVRRRLTQLIDDGVVRVSASVDPRALGYTTFAIVRIRVQAKELERVSAFLRSREELGFFGTLLGRFNLYAGLQCRSRQDLSDLVLTLRAMDGVLETRTSESFEAVKIDNRWGKIQEADAG